MNIDFKVSTKLGTEDRVAAWQTGEGDREAAHRLVDEMFNVVEKKANELQVGS